MNYANTRSKIRSGDIIALTHTDWNSTYDLKVQAVRIGTQSDYAHVGVAWVVGGRVFLIESVTPLVRLVPLSLKAKEGFYWVPSRTAMTKEELEFGLSKVGEGRYSVWQGIKAYFRRLKIGADNLWECAEFVIAMRGLSGLDLGDLATPAGVIKAAQRAGLAVMWVSPDDLPDWDTKE